MEPRIATLLAGSSVDRPAVDPLSWLWPAPAVTAAPRRPHPVEPSTANDDVRSNTAPSGSSLARPNLHRHSPGQQAAAKRQKPSVPIAGVLNDETPTASVAAVTPFSGRLSDLLLDPSQQHSNKRKRDDEPADAPAPTGAENSLLKLPKPHPKPKKTAKRPMIPPLLQGLHHPPAFAQSRLFPPITSESGAFGRDIGDGVGRNAAATDERKDSPRAKSEDAPSGARQKSQASRQAKAAPVSTGDKENRTSISADVSPGAIETKAKKQQKRRNKWSDQETKDLLVGVSRFGIGNWKKILQCPDFTFSQRTAVDLKDRFRTCCPGEGLKPRQWQRKTGEQDDSPPTITSSFATSNESEAQDSVAPEKLSTVKAPRKPRAESHRKGPAELHQMGIYSRFVKNNRRERRAFTEEDDANLLKGFEKYGSSWHSIRDDRTLGFYVRQATDLRDRFRIRYPEKFAKAGYKLKPKDERMLKEKETEKEGRHSQDSVNSVQSDSASDPSKVQDSTTDTSFSSLTSTASSNPSLMSMAPRESFLTSFPGPLEDFGDLGSEEDGDNSRSPVILNRNIFEWAAANPSQVTGVPAANLPAMGTLAGDAPLNVFNGTDGMQMNTMVLDLPMALMTSNGVSSTTSYPPASRQPTSSRRPRSIQHGNTASANSTSSVATSGNATGSTVKQSNNPLLRTPNLPTIVFPHVPASSARSAVHNLPPPADLLSGLDVDVRPEAQTAPFLFDDGSGYVLPSTSGAGYTPSATLAPMVNSAPGRGVLTLDKGLLEELGLEKRGSRNEAPSYHA